MSLPKRIIRDRLHTYAVWVTQAYTELAETAGVISERMMRYVIAIMINGDQQVKRDVEISSLDEAGTAGTAADHTVKFSDINVPPAENVQLPDGSYDIEHPIMVMEGGTRGPYARTLNVGSSVNVTVVYWDSDI